MNKTGTKGIPIPMAFFWQKSAINQQSGLNME
jgi:hypothetical protein